MNKLNLAYGTDEESLNGSGEFSSYEEALFEAILENDSEIGETIYICEIYTYIPTPCATQLVERMNEDAYENCGEQVDGWPDASKEEIELLQIKLSALVSDWLKEIKQDKPRFWRCGKQKSFKVTEDHIRKLNGGTSGGR